MKWSRFGDTKTFRAYHRKVWGRVWEKAWFAITVLPCFLAGAMVWTHPLARVVWTLGLVFFVHVVAHRAGRSYAELDLYLQLQASRTNVLKELREHLIEGGATEEEADTHVWRLELEL